MNITQIGNNVIIVNGKKLPELPKKFNYSKIYTTNSNIYWNGYKYISDQNNWEWSLIGWILCFL